MKTNIIYLYILFALTLAFSNHLIANDKESISCQAAISSLKSDSSFNGAPSLDKESQDLIDQKNLKSQLLNLETKAVIVPDPGAFQISTKAIEQLRILSQTYYSSFLEKLFFPNPLNSVDQTNMSEEDKSLLSYWKKVTLEKYFRTSPTTLSHIKDRVRVPSKVLAKVVYDGSERLLHTLGIIDNSKYEVWVSMYIFENDETAKAVLDSLKRAVERGVMVNFMVDGIGSASTLLKGRKYLDALLLHSQKKAGLWTNPSTQLKTKIPARIQIVVYNRLTGIITTRIQNAVRQMINFSNRIFKDEKAPLLEPIVYRWNSRSHKKHVAADLHIPNLAVAMISSSNIGDHYSGKPGSFVDVATVYQNIPGAETNAQLLLDIAEDLTVTYLAGGNESLSPGFIRRLFFGSQKELEELITSYAGIKEFTREAQEKLGINMDDPNYGATLLDPNGKGWGEAITKFLTNAGDNFDTTEKRAADQLDAFMKPEKIEKIIQEMEELAKKGETFSNMAMSMLNEKEEIVIASPYLFLTPKDIVFLKYVMKKNPSVKLTIFSNSAASSDSPFTQAMFDVATIPRLKKALGPIFEERVRVNTLGRLVDMDLKPEDMAKFHAKFLLLKGQKMKFSGTNNKDFRSQLRNLEDMVQVWAENPDADLPPEWFEKFNEFITLLEGQCTEWGSEEWTAIRKSKKLPAMQRYGVIFQELIVKLLEKSKIVTQF